MELIVTSREDLERMITEAVSRAIAQIKPAAQKEPKYLTVAEAAKKLKVAPLTIYRGMNKGTVPFKQVGSKKLIPSTYLEK